jgi:hypothetical protein
LLLCWPPYNTSAAYKCLIAFAGETLAYIGEGPEGCTGDKLFHQTLQKEWVKTKKVTIPQWPNLHDQLIIYKRKKNAGKNPFPS